MDRSCLVSIVVPVHNTADYLNKCVDSLRNQTLNEIEIILVDNLSTDGSSEICDEHASIDSRIKVLHLPVAGLSIARNAGMDVANAPYIGFIDSDDYVEPDMFEEMVNALKQNDVEIAYCNFVLEYDSKSAESPYQNSGIIYLRSSRKVLEEMLLDKVSCSACTKLYRSDFLTSLRFPEGKNYEDRLVMYEWISLCKKIVWVDKPFYHYVERKTSISHTMTPLNLYHFFLAEYSRLQFMADHSLLKGEILFKVRSILVGTCLSLFKEIMLKVRIRDFKEPIKDMKRKIKQIASFPRGTLEAKYHKRAQKITRFWWIYYLTHYAYKKK